MHETEGLQNEQRALENLDQQISDKERIILDSDTISQEDLGLSEFERLKEQLQAQHQKIVEQKEILAIQIREARNVNNELQAGLDSDKNRLKNTNEDIRKFETLCSHLEAEIIKSETQRIAAQKGVCAAEKISSAISEEVTELKKELQCLAKELEGLANENNALTATEWDFDTVKEEIAEIQENSRIQASKQNGEIQLLTETTQRELAILNLQKHTLQQEIGTCTANIKIPDLESDISQLEHELRTSRSTQAALEDALKEEELSLPEDVDASSANIGRLESRLAELQKSYAMVETEIIDWASFCNICQPSILEQVKSKSISLNDMDVTNEIEEMKQKMLDAHQKEMDDTEQSFRSVITHSMINIIAISANKQ
eukprot:Gregarina_sp_Poly_1__10937@NODE_85_length_15275_cov_135_187336_g73_i0_p5_GENE_NODE_85_length_15275_cov_135_187336_g73_i0NODE_85_length_15275_cov_135_187336_g73_i0_p5_ORF_typecomplete_len372_score68_32Myosin_tail_1/PF01576_19/0_27Myosin_tail_1/PF01576_19/0_00011LzipperMIP1/PF14389_6/0_00016Filament/PF00038_21/0_00043Filament/PF00038_21/1_1e02MAD/PF05557_13/0_046MAD/PF05557_13/0_0036DUF3600/PF12207_8/1_7e02DUF3600/PF12207_8/0_0013DUF3600/PF12207_8/2_6e03APG6_N/PF17675_1/4_9e02APG6_N/PF17675_1/0_00